MAQAAIVLMVFLLFVTARAMFSSSSRVQVLADDAHQEDGNDIGKDNGIDTTGRPKAHILALQHPLEDQIGQRLGAESAAGSDERSPQKSTEGRSSGSAPRS